MVEQNENKGWGNLFARILALFAFGFILTHAVKEFYQVAWGTGEWYGEFSFKWVFGFIAVILFCIASWFAAAFLLWRWDTFDAWSARITALRKKLGPFRWLAVLALLAFPVWLLQYTPWGIVFGGIYIRLLIWIFVALGMAVFLQSGTRLLKWTGFLASLLLTSSAFSVAAALINVSDYPFSMGWSEGNRMWDYSMMFGRHLYDYPQDEHVYVLLDVGRQFIGGLPFILPAISIQAERLWVGLTTIVPYLLLGFAAFRSDFKNVRLWFLLAFWTFIFLKQGPIHPPLVICALAVALVWRSSLWLGIPLIFATGYFAVESRYTWLFAPAIWIVMLEFVGAKLENGRVQSSTWGRAVALGIAGALGGYFGPALLNWSKALFAAGDLAPLAGGSVSVSAVASEAAAQPLLWYRLFPNATYGVGILLALLIAVAPTLALLFYLSATKKWILNTWQKLALLLPSLAFLAVGLIVSTKIGGGGDLHNLDMFLIGVFFSAVIAWENGGREWLGQIATSPLWVKSALVLLLVIPGIQPLSALRSFGFAEDLSRLVRLTDVTDGKLLELLPPDDEVDDILQTIRREVEFRKSLGDVLFLDQRQLLTFGYVQDVPFVHEYEKKILMNAAMGAETGYFAPFYTDLAARRFSLIITEPLRAPVKDSNYQFGEENNAWVRWVVEPVLCYYEPIETFRSVQIQLLVPKQGQVDCAEQLPIDPATLE